MRIAIIGGGISGITAAKVLQQCGHRAVVFERAVTAGGVWAVAYPEVRLQNTAEHYRLSDFPWPFSPDLHPTREQILRYWQAAVERYQIDLRLQHEVVALTEQADGWQLDYRTRQKTVSERFDFVVVASGHYTGEPERLRLAHRERFAGVVVTDREVQDLDLLAHKQVAVIGFGKSAADMATMAAQRGARVHHVFRAPRWLIPKYLLGIHSSKLLFARMSTAFIPSWVHPTRAERFLHEHLQPLVGAFWSMVTMMVRLRCGLHPFHQDPKARKRLALLLPGDPMTFQMRSAVALAPANYFPLVAEGRIEPHLGEVAGFDTHALSLTDGRQIPCDLVVLSTGFQSPRFPFLSPAYRDLLEREPDGVQLYRHLLHPRIPRLGFAGFNHGFLHVAAVEVGMLWLSAYLRGDLTLPAMDQMESCSNQVRTWKREHVLFEPSRSCGVNTRFHQYLDVLLGDLGLRPYRKANPVSELLAGYTAGDYEGLVNEYERARATAQLPRQPLPLCT